MVFIKFQVVIVLYLFSSYFHDGRIGERKRFVRIQKILQIKMSQDLDFLKFWIPKLAGSVLMTNVVGVEMRGEAKRDVTLGAVLTNDDKLWKIADFRKNFHKGVFNFQFQAFLCTCCDHVRLLYNWLPFSSHIKTTNDITIRYPYSNAMGGDEWNI